MYLHRFASSGHFIEMETRNTKSPITQLSLSMFSRFVHVRACIRAVLNCFVLLNSIPVRGCATFYYLTVDGHLIVPTFWLLRVMMLGIFVNKFLWGYTFSSFAFKPQRWDNIRKAFKVMNFSQNVSYSTEKIDRCYTPNKINIHLEKTFKIDRKVLLN